MTAVLDPFWWRQHGYLAVQPLDAGLWLIVAPMLFTYRVMVCTQTAPTGEHYCYPNLAAAIDCFHHWNGGPHNPTPGWTKHHRTNGTAEWPTTVNDDQVPDVDDQRGDDGHDAGCQTCAGEGTSECDDPYACFDPACTGEIHTCPNCGGSGLARDQRYW